MSDATPDGAEAQEKVPPLSSLGYRDFRLLWFGMPFSSTGQWMRNTANAWQVFEISDSSVLLGLTFLFQGLPAMVMGLFGGTLADIFDRRKLIIVTLSSQIVLVLLLAGLTVSGEIQVWHIYAITFGSSALSSAEGPARMALIPRLVPRSHVLNATTLLSTASEVSLLIGPVFAGVVIASVGVGATYFINAALIIPAMVAILRLRLPPDAARGRVKLNLAAVFEGLIFAIKTRVLIAFLALDTITMVLGYFPAMMPLFAKDILEVGPIGLGALLSAPAFGALLGFIAILLIGNIRRKGVLILAATVLYALVLISFSASPWFFLSLILVAFLGFLDAMSVSVRLTSFQLLAPDAVRGRVMSLVHIFAIGSNSMGGAYLGLATSLLGARLALGMGGAISGSIALLIALLWRQVREFKA